jgi:hypothetical protein
MGEPRKVGRTTSLQTAGMKAGKTGAQKGIVDVSWYALFSNF